MRKGTAHNGRQIGGGEAGVELLEARVQEGRKEGRKEARGENYTSLPLFPQPWKGLRVNKTLVCGSSGCARVAGIIQRRPGRP